MNRKIKRGPGQPSKLTPESKQRFISAVRQGNYFRHAAKFAGFDIQTLYAWLARGRREKTGEYAEFLDAVEAAESEAQPSIVNSWRAQIPADWHAAATFLARRYPEEWGVREAAPQEVTVNIKHGNDSRDKSAKPSRSTKRDQRK